MQPTAPAYSFTNVLLLAEREDLAAVDRRALREAGLRNITIESSGCEAARLLSRPEGSIVQVVLCNEQLADMSGDEFVHLVRLHPRLLLLPVLGVVTALNRQTEAMIRSARYSGLLVRPYTQQQLRDQLGRAAQWLRQLKAAMGTDSPGTDTIQFEEALQRYEQVRKAEDANAGQQYRQGLLCVRQHNWDEGISLLQQVIRENPHHGEAIVALATAWRGKGNEAKSRAMLREAVAVFVENATWDKAFAVTERLMADEPGLSNPLLEEAGRLVVAGQYDGAAEAVLLARKLSSDDTVLDTLVRAGLAGREPAKALRGLFNALAEHGESQLAQELESRLTLKMDVLEREALRVAADGTVAGGTSAGGAAGETASGRGLLGRRPQDAKRVSKRGEDGHEAYVLREPGASFLDDFPTLRDAWNVAKVTASLFRMLK